MADHSPPSMDNAWPFDEPPNVAVILDAAVLSKTDWIAMAARDEEDGAWQFIGSRIWSGEQRLDPSIAKVVGLANVCKLDHTILELASLEPGFVAERSGPTSEWKVSRRKSTHSASALD